MLRQEIIDKRKVCLQSLSVQILLIQTDTNLDKFSAYIIFVQSGVYLFFLRGSVVLEIGPMLLFFSSFPHFKTSSKGFRGTVKGRF